MCACILTSVVAITIGKYRMKNRPWTTNEILDLCDLKSNLKYVKEYIPIYKTNFRNIKIRK